jgi:hypothetical protein
MQGLCLQHDKVQPVSHVLASMKVLPQRSEGYHPSGSRTFSFSHCIVERVGLIASAVPLRRSLCAGRLVGVHSPIVNQPHAPYACRADHWEHKGRGSASGAHHAVCV